VMLGCTETTFYTVAVYFGAAGIKRTRYTIPAALTADLAAYLAAAWSVRLFFGT
jgi:spore maturation protein B